MSGKKRLIEFVFVVLIVFVVSAFRTVTARADDATPPPTATPEVTQPTDDGSTVGTQVAPTDAATQSPTDATVTQTADTSTPLPLDATVTQAADTSTPVPTDETVTEATEPSTSVDTSTATPAPTQASGDAGPTSTDTTALLVSPVPQGSRLVLLSDQQPAIPLGSAEAATLIAAGDPIWCPSGVTPKANTGGCTGFFYFFNGGFLGDLAGKTTNGTIWIESSYNSLPNDSSGVTLDPSLGTTTYYALTLQGGWDGHQGGTTIVGSSTFSVPLTIEWNADVTLKDIEVKGVNSIWALNVSTPKNITLTGVNVHDNTGYGAVLNNQAIGSGTGNVTVTSSQFNNNQGGSVTGLEAYSNGTITLSNVTADNNGGYGADLQNQTASSAKSVTLTSGPYQFNGNGQAGLNIVSKGAIAVKDIDALNNGSDGADLINCLYNGTNCDGGSGTITLTGSNVFAGNGGWGLYAYSNGAISANNLVANGNGSWGAELVNVDATLAQPVTLTGNSNQFKSNMAGLDIYSMGNITLNSITASYNSGDPGTGWPSGAELDDCVYDSTAKKCTGTGNLILTGTNTFDENYRSGLMAYSGGTITISNLTADGNGHAKVTPANSAGYGALLSNLFAKSPKSITLTGTNSFSDNYDDNLFVQSLGAISAGNITANHSEIGRGAYLDNQWSGAVGSLTITGVNTFNFNAGYGLEIYSNGAFSLNGLDAEENGGYGASIDNYYGSTAPSLTLTGTNRFDSNGNDGLFIHSKGAVTLNSVAASWNDGDGAYIDNSGAATPKSVTLSGTNQFNNNAGDGLFVISKGIVTTNNLNAAGNGTWNEDPSVNSPPLEGYGVYIVNDLAPSSHQNVLLNGINSFYNNWFGGLAVDSYGTITTNNISANNNGQGGFGSLSPGNDGLGGYADWADGVFLNNCRYSSGPCSDPASESISVKGTNWFDSNQGSGLMMFSTGAITTNNLEADSNSGGWGVGFYNAYPGVTAGITMTGFADTYSNAFDGISATSHGPITTNNISSADNGSGCPSTDCYGAYLDNSYATSAVAVNLNGSNYLDTNTFGGLYIASKGAITLNNIVASYSSSGYGASLNNTFGSTASNVTITGSSNWFENNSADGLDVASNGSITLTNVSADNNSNAGALLNNAFNLSSPQNVSLAGANQFNGNGDTGLVISTYGTIAVNNVTANGNGTNAGSYGWGAYLDNCGFNGSDCTSTLAKSITLTGTNVFENNFKDGLWATSRGPLSLSNLTANENQGDGVYLSTDGQTTLQNVTLTGNNTFLSNGNDGLAVFADGNITVNNVTAKSNGLNGTRLDNCLWDTGTSKCMGSGTLTLNGTNTFFNNSSDGLYVYSHKNITMSEVTADENGIIGVAGYTDGTITVLGGSMTHNGSYGWEFNAFPTITLKGVFAYDNNGGGYNANLLGGTLVVVRTYP